jgi:DnaJ-class molecular chaperone
MSNYRQIMMKKDYYKILGVERTASTIEIKEAYYNLARRLHPDIIGYDPKLDELFLEVQEAYHVLGNLENRLNYSIYLNSEIIEQELLNKNFNLKDLDRKTLRRQSSKFA